MYLTHYLAASMRSCDTYLPDTSLPASLECILPHTPPSQNGSSLINNVHTPRCSWLHRYTDRYRCQKSHRYTDRYGGHMSHRYTDRYGCHMTSRYTDRYGCHMSHLYTDKYGCHLSPRCTPHTLSDSSLYILSGPSLQEKPHSACVFVTLIDCTK